MQAGRTRTRQDGEKEGEDGNKAGKGDGKGREGEMQQRWMSVSALLCLPSFTLQINHSRQGLERK